MCISNCGKCILFTVSMFTLSSILSLFIYLNECYVITEPRQISEGRQLALYFLYTYIHTHKCCTSRLLYSYVLEMASTVRFRMLSILNDCCNKSFISFYYQIRMKKPEVYKYSLIGRTFVFKISKSTTCILKRDIILLNMKLV